MDCAIIIYFVFLVSVSGQKLYQDQISETRSEKQSVSFNCRVSGQCLGNEIHWYHKKDGEAFTWRESSKSTELKIQSLNASHSATYYCACYQSGTGVKTFGSGTRLYVTAQHESIQKPKVMAYPASKPEPNGKTILLCLARGMFPDLVQISWKMVDGSGQKLDVPPGEKIQLEQREKGQTTSMIIIDKGKVNTKQYSCSVEHERGVQEVNIPKVPASEKPTKAPPAFMATPTCPSRNDPQDPVTLEVDGFFQSMFSLNLASLVYTVMTVKSLVYCCGITLLLQRRNMGSRTSKLMN